jgi:hypothetical protein
LFIAAWTSFDFIVWVAPLVSGALAWVHCIAVTDRVETCTGWIRLFRVWILRDHRSDPQLCRRWIRTLLGKQAAASPRGAETRG